MLKCKKLSYNESIQDCKMALNFGCPSVVSLIIRRAETILKEVTDIMNGFTADFEVAHVVDQR